VTAARTLPRLPAVHPAGCMVAQVVKYDTATWLFTLACGVQIRVPVADTPWGTPSPSYTQYLNHQCPTTTPGGPS
jgi:hypothetical protein